MSTLESLRDAPYHLDDASLAWVASKLESMDLDTRLRQLFVLALLGDDLGAAAGIAAFRAGGVVRAPGPIPEAAFAATVRSISGARVPMLVAADIEGGVNHPASLPAAPNAMAVAAAADTELAFAAFHQMALDAKAQGFNWSLGPVLDLSANFRSAIVGTRSFGTDPDVVGTLAAAYVGAMQTSGLAATAKHWPGDGYDERDQHLVTTVNPLTLEEWDSGPGRLYRQMISKGVLSVMSAHIALPAFARRSGETGGELFRPASVSKHLNQTLLRERLGFRGVIVSDASAMAGLTSWGGPEHTIPQLIANGCDVLLFSVDPERDLALLHAAVDRGQLSPERIEDAVLRILGMKAALGLHGKDAPSTDGWRPESSERTTQRRTVYEEVASRAVTLVKDTRGTLPLTTSAHRRIAVLEQPPRPVLPGMPPPSIEPLIAALRARGFEVIRPAPGKGLPLDSADALLYVLTQESMLTVSEARVDWGRLHGGFPSSMARPWQEKPSVMVSFGHPYHLFDAPRMPVYVNAYACTPELQEAVIRKLVGEEPLLGTSPVDAFCGSEQARH